MFISCPHCQTNYEIETACDDTALLCHRCGAEFFPTGQLRSPNALKDRQMQAYSSNDITDATASGDTQTTAMETEWADIAPPERKKARIWPWLMIMLILIFSAGFWLQKDAWLDNRWFRSTAINLGLPLPLRDKDWSIKPDSVQAEWITRDDATTALLIRGRVKNLLTSELPPPVIAVTFFSDAHPDQKLGSRELIITLHPGKLSLLHVPYTTPDADTVPILPQGEREFVFLIESPPENTGDFTLAARVQ